MAKILPNSVRAIIFDLDGTLLDTLQDLTASTNYALRSHGMPERTIEEVRHFVGNGVHKLICRAVPQNTSEEMIENIYSDFCRHYLEHSLDATCPYEGILPMLVRLKERGFLIAVVSNKLQPAVSFLSERFFRSYVDIALGECDSMSKKPAPDMVLSALRHLGVSKDEAIYVGDSDVDLLTAENSGLPCISVLWGFRDKQFLMEHGATVFLSSPGELE